MGDGKTGVIVEVKGLVLFDFGIVVLSDGKAVIGVLWGEGLTGLIVE